MQKQEERQFSDESGTIIATTTQLPALRSFRLLTRLGKLMGPAIGRLKGVGLKSDMSALLPALMSLFDNLEPDDVDSLTLQILEGTVVEVGGRPTVLSSTEGVNRVFGGRLFLMFKVMVFAIEVNFRDFFRELTPASAQRVSRDSDPKPEESP